VLEPQSSSYRSARRSCCISWRSFISRIATAGPFSKTSDGLKEHGTARKRPPLIHSREKPRAARSSAKLAVAPSSRS
jgi:hypothetical protein